MRLRQLLGVWLTVAICGASAAAAAPELKNVMLVPQGTSTTVTLVATGGFGHNEYRANENLLLVDLTGVSAGKLKDRERKVEVPGIHSYHIVGYKGMNGVDIARMELRIVPDAEVKTSVVGSRLQIIVTTNDAKLTSSGPAPSSPASLKPAIADEVVKISNVSVLRGKDGMEIEVIGSGRMTAKVLKLTSPDRIVLDIPNSLSATRLSTVPVNSGKVKSVRTARYQTTPPVTRVVIDLASPHEYRLNASENKLTVELRPVESAATASLVAKADVPAMHSAVQSPAAFETKMTQPAILPARANAEISDPARPEYKGGSEASVEPKSAVFVEPKYQTKAQENGDPGTAADKKLASQNLPVQTAALQQPQNAPRLVVAAEPASKPVEQQGQTMPVKPVYTGEPISVNLKDVDLKDFFRLIHEVSGLNVVLDPGVRGALTLVLDDVPWDQALDIVLKNNGLDRQLQGNVLRIATIDGLRKEAQSKRLQLEAEALAVPKVSITRFLSYAHAKDSMASVKKLLSTRGDIIADERMNALIIQDIPSVIPEVDRLIAELDRKTRQVDIEARVIASTRTFKREIGTQIGIGWGNGPSAIGGATAVGTSPLGGIASAPKYFISSTLQQIPLVTNFLPETPSSGIAFTNASNAYRIDVLLAAAESRGLVKILSRPHIVTQNNIQAVVKQGMKIPVVTQSQLSGPPTVTYIEAVLRLTVTPQITNDNTIFLNLDIENTTPDFSNKILGNPVFLTEQATTQVLVTDGGTVMVGGVIQTQNSVNIMQTPFLGDLPILGNLFKKRSVDNATQELIFILTPKIVQT